MEFRFDGHPLMCFPTHPTSQKGNTRCRKSEDVFKLNAFQKSGRQEQMPFSGNAKLGKHLQLTRTDKSIYLVTKQTSTRSVQLSCLRSPGVLCISFLTLITNNYLFNICFHGSWYGIYPHIMWSRKKTVIYLVHRQAVWVSFISDSTRQLPMRVVVSAPQGLEDRFQDGTSQLAGWCWRTRSGLLVRGPHFLSRWVSP